MGPQYQATVDSYAASPQAAQPQQVVQSDGNQTLGKALEQSPVHAGFGTSSGMYDNGMDVSAQPAPVASPPQPKNQPATAGVNPSWAQQGRKRGGRAKRADGGPLAAFGGAGKVSPLMMTGDTIAALGANAPAQAQVPPSIPATAAAQYAAAPVQNNYQGQYKYTPEPLYMRNMSNEDFVRNAYLEDLNRNPDPSGYQGWLNDLNSGRLSQSQLENEFYKSREYQQNQADIERARAVRNEALSAQMNTPEARQRMLAQGIIPDVDGMVDPFVAGYNARMANAQSQFGPLARQNYYQTQGQQQEYQQELEKIQQANAARLEAAKQEKARRDAEAQAQQQAALMMMMMMRR